MTQFHEQSWSGRYASMGDEAEAKFRELNPSHARFGLDRPPVNLGKVPAFIRYMPDYLLHDRLVECMGVGRDQTLKLKLDKLDILLKWDRTHSVWLFIWDSHYKRWAILTIQDLALVAALADISEFHEGKPYYAIPLDALRVAWHGD